METNETPLNPPLAAYHLSQIRVGPFTHYVYLQDVHARAGAMLHEGLLYKT